MLLSTEFQFLLLLIIQLNKVIVFFFVFIMQAVYKDLCKNYKVEIPQCKPLSPGEILGCTAPKIKDKDAFM